MIKRDAIKTLLKLIQQSILLNNSDKKNLVELINQNQSNSNFLERLIVIFKKAENYYNAIQKTENNELFKIEKEYSQNLAKLLKNLQKDKESSAKEEELITLENISTELDNL